MLRLLTDTGYDHGDALPRRFPELQGYLLDEASITTIIQHLIGLDESVLEITLEWFGDLPAIQVQVRGPWEQIKPHQQEIDAFFDGIHHLWDNNEEAAWHVALAHVAPGMWTERHLVAAGKGWAPDNASRPQLAMSQWIKKTSTGI